LRCIKKCDTQGGTWPWIMCSHISKKKSKPFTKSFRTKTISFKLIHHTRGATERKNWWTNQSRNKWVSILSNLCFKMENINKRGKINFNKWMENAKDFYGLVKWGFRCVWNYCTYCLNIFPYINKGLCAT